MKRPPRQDPYFFEPLSARHNRSAFRCGVPALDMYLQRQARQDVDRKLASVFVLTADGETIAGFYTLSSHSILVAHLPERLARKLPRFPLPVTLLGRMALSHQLQGQGLGEALLFEALETAWEGSKKIASWAVIVDAKAGAREFYLKHDFEAFPSQPDRLFLLMSELDKLFV